MARQRKATIGLGLGLVAVAVMGILAYRSMNQNDEERHWVTHTYMVLENIDTFSVTLEQTANTPNATAGDFSPLQSRIEDLRSLTADNPVQQKTLGSLQSAVSDLARLRQESKEQGVDDEGAGLMAELEETRGLLSHMRIEELRRLNERRKAVEGNSARTRLAIVVGNVVAVAFLTIMLFSVDRETKARAKAEEALRKSEATSRGLLENAPDGIVVVDSTGRITLVNSQTETLFGYERKELIGHAIEMLLPDRFRGAHPAHVENFYKNPYGRPMGKGLDLYGQRSDGREFPVEISLSPLQTGEGVLVSATIRDVTESRQAEKMIKRLNLRLEERAGELLEINQELEAFTYTAAHDLRAPLRHLHGYSSFLKELWYGRMDDEGRHFLDRIMAATNGMATLLDELLNFSRLGRIEVRMQDVNLQNLVERIRQEMRGDPGVKRVTWQIGNLPEIQGDQGLLYQVLFNLVSNAVKYSRKTERPKIEIGSKIDAEQGKVTVFIRDNGTGFDMQYANKLFQVFQRLHRTKDYEGTGIGLAIVRRVIERHGGRVWAEGTVGRGAAFYFSLPLRRTEHGQARVHSIGG